jgi:hypothetical protein
MGNYYSQGYSLTASREDIDELTEQQTQQIDVHISTDNTDSSSDGGHHVAESVVGAVSPRQNATVTSGVTSWMNRFSLYFGATQLYHMNPEEEVLGYNERQRQAQTPLSAVMNGLNGKGAADTITVKSPVNLNKISLKLIPRDEPGSYNVKFVFDTIMACEIQVFFFCKESALPVDVPRYHHEAGIGQVFITNDSYFLNTNDRSEEEFFESEEEVYYPIIILIEPIGNEEEEKISQTSYVSLTKCGDVFEVKSIDQKILYKGVPYTVHDIYGIDDNSEAILDECVICMTEFKDTVVIPCRHMCVCHQCAQVLHYQSNKCPICRGAVRSMLKIKITKNDENDSPENTASTEKEEVSRKDEVFPKNIKKKKSLLIDLSSTEETEA